MKKLTGGRTDGRRTNCDGNSSLDYGSSELKSNLHKYNKKCLSEC